MKSTGLVLAAGGLAVANEVIFAPIASGNLSSAVTDFNWRIIPATAILAITLGGLETVSPALAVGLAALSLLAVLLAQTGNAPAPLTNIASVVNGGAKSTGAL